MRSERLHPTEVAGRTLCYVAPSPMSASELLAAAGLSKRQATQVLGEGRITRSHSAPSGNRPALTSSSMIDAGEAVTLRLAHTPPTIEGAAAPHTTSPADVPGALVLACDPFFLAANKPAGLLVHGDGTGAHTLTDDVAAWLATHGSDATPQALQRLDVETTGIVLFSLTEEFQPSFDALVAGHEMEKRYLAVVEGKVPDSLTRIESPIGRDRHDARRMRVSATGKPACTELRVIACKKGRTLLEVRIETGRRHQIRVHLASKGHPLVGDRLYGRPDPSGLALHSHHTTFIHPVTGQRVDVRAPWPERFGQLGFDGAFLTPWAVLNTESARV